MQRQRSILALIIVLLFAAILVLTRVPIKLGLDLQGGAQLTIQVKQPEDGKPQVITPSDMEGLQAVLQAPDRDVHGTV